jgi:hypothetical protein
MTKRKGKPVSFDAMVKFFMHNYNIPTKRDIDQLNARLDRLEKLIRAMSPRNRRTTGKNSGDSPKSATETVLDLIRRSKKWASASPRSGSRPATMIKSFAISFSDSTKWKKSAGQPRQLQSRGISLSRLDDPKKQKIGTGDLHEQKTDANNPGINAGDRLAGYVVKKRSYLTDIQSWLYQLEHEGTGARHIHISNKDQENTFGVAFKTVPTDSTGVAHILEHTVLCGSERFPVRDPFFSMLKRSLSTFMNAFTASDWTMYPFATQNRKDYYNLMDVYLDAAFFPTIDELSFKQEGHRLDLEGDETDTRLVYKGVVYNEMKGAMSSPDQVMVRSMLNALYPDTTYSNNSGGEPSVIPSLTYQQLKDFHARHYHPSNAFFTPTAICSWKTTWPLSRQGCSAVFHASIREPTCPHNRGGRRRKPWSTPTRWIAAMIRQKNSRPASPGCWPTSRTPSRYW